MRIVAIAPLILLAACTARQPANNSADAANTLTAAAPLPPGARGPQPANSVDALAAKKVVEQYYALIKAKKYAEARLLWGNEGADAGGDVAAFAKTITPYSVYQPKVAGTSHIEVADGMQYVKVVASLHVKRRDTGAEADRDGAVTLRRSIDPNDPATDKRDWKIRGIDIRMR